MLHKTLKFNWYFYLLMDILQDAFPYYHAVQRNHKVKGKVWES